MNRLAASGPGTTSNNTTGSFTIGTRTDYTENQNAIASGLASSRSSARRRHCDADGTCGTFGSPTTIVGHPPRAAWPTAATATR